jgi:hypothetical protein
MTPRTTWLRGRSRSRCTSRLHSILSVAIRRYPWEERKAYFYVPYSGNLTQEVAGRIRNIGIVVVAMTSVVSMAKRTTLKRMSWYFERVKRTSSWSFVQHEVSLGGSIIQEIAQGHGSRCDPEFVLHLPRAVLLCSPGIRSAITGSLYPLARFIPCYHLCAPFLYISDCFGCLLWLPALVV